MTLRSSDLQSEGDLDSIRNSCDVLVSKHWVTRPKNFIETDTETLFRDQNFWDRDQDFFSRPNIFKTDTETFFRDQMYSRPIPRDQMFLRLIPRLFFLDQIFWDRYRDFFFRPNVFETDTKTFFVTNFFETKTKTFRDKFSWDWDKIYIKFIKQNLLRLILRLF